MKFMMNPTAFSAAFTVPCEVADRHLRLANETQLKVLLYVLRNLAGGVDHNAAAQALGLPPQEAEDAMLYWTQAGIFLGDTPAAPEKPTPVSVPKAEKPSRADIARRGMEDPKIRFLLQEAQMKFERPLKSNESATLVWLYDDLGMDISLILFLIQYARERGSCNITFLEKTAKAWVDQGVESVTDAEAQVAETLRRQTAWGVVERAFGLNLRRPSKKEEENAAKWVLEWEFPEEMLRLAYDTCVDAKSEFSFPYAAKIIERWHKDGITSPEALLQHREKEASKKEQPGGATYDLDSFEKKLRSELE